MLRIFVQGGGCSGMTYGFTFDTELNEDDFEFEINDRHRLVMDGLSSPYLQGSTIDYSDSILESRFVIINPNSTGSCGCGSSFSV